LVSIGIVILSECFQNSSCTISFLGPDVYEGSPALTTAALMSTLAKVVAIATLFKLLNVMNADLSASFQIIIVIISMASMTVGNIVRQVNVKRMLAFLNFACRFMLMTLLSAANAAGSLLYYTSAYALTGIAAYSIRL
jgi:NADH-quinone oxidoreductase subunit N